MSRLPLVLGAAAAVLMVAACGAPGSQSPRAERMRTGAVSVGFAAPSPADAAAVAKLTGTTPAYLSAYAGPGSSFPAGWAALAEKDKATLVVQLDTGPASLSAVASGSEDAWLRSFAKSAATWHGPLAIGIDHEFNGPWWPWSYNHQSGASFVAAWRHIVKLFRSEGVHASWVWTVSNVTGHQAGPLAPYWPGAKYVTLIGLNAYYYSAPDTFANTFAPVMREASSLAALPVLITETGASPVAGRVRAMRDLFAGAASDPSVLGLIWFDFDKPSAHGPDHDWRIDGDPAALAAFRAAVRTYG